MYSWPDNPIHEPTRRFRRATRLLLANIREGEHSEVLQRVATGSIDQFIVFLAACRISFIFVALTHDLRAYGVCGPDLSAAVRIGSHALGLPVLQVPDEVVAGSVAETKKQFTELRSDAVEEALDRVLLDLALREDFSFTLAWQAARMAEPRLDHSLSLDERYAVGDIKWFMREVFKLDTFNRSKPSQAGGALHVV